MTVNSINIDGFGCLTGRFYDLSEGINAVYGGTEDEKTAFVCFIQAILFGFKTEEAAQPDGSGCAGPAAEQPEGAARPPFPGYAAAADRRPERAAFRPQSGAPFGGAISFCEGGRTFDVQAQWGEGPAADRIVLKADRDDPVLLAPGETVCAVVYGLSGADGFALTSGVPDEYTAAALAARLESLALSRAHAGGAASARASSGQEARAHEILGAARARLANSDGSGILQLEEQREQEMIRQLKELAGTEAKAGEYAAKARALGAEKAAAENSAFVIPDFDRLRRNIALSSKAAEAKMIGSRIGSLEDAARRELKSAQRKKRPVYIILWVLLAVDALGLAALLLADKIPALSVISDLIADRKYILVPALALLFILLMLGLIATATGGLKRYSALTDELQFNRKKLGDLLGLDPDGADGDPEIFDEVVKIAQTGLNEQADLAELEIQSAGELHMAGLSHFNSLCELREQLSGAEAARDALYGELAERTPYNLLEDELAGLRNSIAAHRKEYAALDTADRLITSAANRLNSDFLPRLSEYASRALSALTAGRRNEFSYTDRFEPRVSENGELCPPSDFQGLDYAQIMLAAAMAPLSLLKADGALAPLLLVLDDPFSAFDNSSRRQALMVLKEFAAANGLQLIYTAPAEELSANGSIRL